MAPTDLYRAVDGRGPSNEAMSLCKLFNNMDASILSVKEQVLQRVSVYRDWMEKYRDDLKARLENGSEEPLVSVNTPKPIRSRTRIIRKKAEPDTTAANSTQSESEPSRGPSPPKRTRGSADSDNDKSSLNSTATSNKDVGSKPKTPVQRSVRQSRRMSVIPSGSSPKATAVDKLKAAETKRRSSPAKMESADGGTKGAASNVSYGSDTSAESGSTDSPKSKIAHIVKKAIRESAKKTRLVLAGNGLAMSTRKQAPTRDAAPTPAVQRPARTRARKSVARQSTASMKDVPKADNAADNKEDKNSDSKTDDRSTDDRRTSKRVSTRISVASKAPSTSSLKRLFMSGELIHELRHMPPSQRRSSVINARIEADMRRSIALIERLQRQSMRHATADETYVVPVTEEENYKTASEEEVENGNEIEGEEQTDADDESDDSSNGSAIMPTPPTAQTFTRPYVTRGSSGRDTDSTPPDAQRLPAAGSGTIVVKKAPVSVLDRGATSSNSSGKSGDTGSSHRSNIPTPLGRQFGSELRQGTRTVTSAMKKNQFGSGVKKPAPYLVNIKASKAIEVLRTDPEIRAKVTLQRKREEEAARRRQDIMSAKIKDQREKREKNTQRVQETRQKNEQEQKAKKDFPPPAPTKDKVHELKKVRKQREIERAKAQQVTTDKPPDVVVHANEQPPESPIQKAKAVVDTADKFLQPVVKLQTITVAQIAAVAPAVGGEPPMNGTYTKATRQAVSAATAAAGSSGQNDTDNYEITPKDAKYLQPSGDLNNYNIEGLDSGDSTDDESQPKKKVPKWALGAEIKATLINQYLRPPDVEAIFDLANLVTTVDLEDVFKVKKKRFKERTSSAIWHTPFDISATGLPNA